MFNKLLIANRGEIACRIVKTARQLGIRTVAVYSDADAGAAHVAMADEAYRIGPPSPRESYLDIEAVLSAAKQARADAIHPGYGFLSENAAFAAACDEAAITFVGPPVAAIEAMGSKSESKRIMENAHVPLIPGYHGDDQSPERLAAEAAAIGYPVLLKASAGGGGRGMRVVTAPGEFADALDGARREATGAFGDDHMLIETYVTGPRHVEIQIFADTHGNIVHLFERDCSAQRRHQKIIEEAPAPGLSEVVRTRMCETAIAAARAIGYVGAGTVELLLDRSGHFYFMEMNTRLQVEHPVTELVTGEDLVEWQLLVAAGDPLPRHQDELRLHGHAIEARLYAEDPAKKFMPSTGRLSHLRFPQRDPLVRIDSGVREGDEISFYYDPMIAKIIAWAETREQAAARLAQALRETEAVGVTTNARFLAKLVSHPRFVEGAIDTGFVAEHGADLVEPAAPITDDVLAAGTLVQLLEREEHSAIRGRKSADPYSPWSDASGWRLNGRSTSTFAYAHGDTMPVVRATPDGAGYALNVPSGETLDGTIERTNGARLTLTLGGVRRTLSAVREGGTLTLLIDGVRYDLQPYDPAEAVSDQHVAPGSLNAPMPGKVIAVNVESGQRVRRGTTVMVMEAMKMEHNIIAPEDGTVRQLHYAVGDMVDEGAELLAIAADE